MLIGVIGDSVQELGGYRTHNPFRLYCRRRFKDFIVTVPEAEVMIALRPGVGQWAAEVCAEIPRPFVVVRPDPWPASWPESTKQTFNSLTMKAARVYLAKDPDEYVVDSTLCYSGSRMCFVALRADKRAGRVCEELSKLDGNGIPVAALHPESMPALYDAIGCVEEAREVVPLNFSKRLREAHARLIKMIDQGALADMQESTRKKLCDRAAQMQLLADVADALGSRG